MQNLLPILHRERLTKMAKRLPAKSIELIIVPPPVAQSGNGAVELQATRTRSIHAVSRYPKPLTRPGKARSNESGAALTFEEHETSIGGLRPAPFLPFSLKGRSRLQKLLHDN